MKEYIPEPIKVLFLDIDGVMVTRKELSEGTPYKFNPDITKMFEDFLTQYPDIKVVLSSAWRKNETVFNKINHNSRLIYRRIIGRTGSHNSGRGEEIKAWLDDYYKEVTHYVIVDDDVFDMLNEQKPYIVQTNGFDGGLKPEHIEQIKVILDLT